MVCFVLMSSIPYYVCVCVCPEPDDDEQKVKTQRPRSADQPGVFQAQTGESPCLVVCSLNAFQNRGQRLHLFDLKERLKKSCKKLSSDSYKGSLESIGEYKLSELDMI